METITHSAEQTKKLALSLAKKLKGGDIVALYGDLGSGKTTFVQGLVKGFGIRDTVRSPTFVFIRFYGKKLKIVHIDLYRINSLDELEDLGLEEFWGGKDTICLIEWPERMENALPKGALKIGFSYISESERRISGNL